MQWLKWGCLETLGPKVQQEENKLEKEKNKYEIKSNRGRGFRWNVEVIIQNTKLIKKEIMQPKFKYQT